MYMDKAWSIVQGEALADILRRVNPIDGKHSVSIETTHVARHSLAFYKNVTLIRIKDPAWMPKNLFIYYLDHNGDFYRLNGTSPPIHEVNAKAPVDITSDNALHYLRFFTFFVRGEEGPFVIAESPNDVYVPKLDDMARGMRDSMRSVFAGTLRPAEYVGKDEMGNHLCDAVVYYSNALFNANFVVRADGMVEMLDDEPIAADLPVKIDAPVA